MRFETISLVLNWMELGALLAILFRLGRVFELIANTQRELRRAIRQLGEGRATEPGVNNAVRRADAAASSEHTRAGGGSTMSHNHLPQLSPEISS